MKTRNVLLWGGVAAGAYLFYRNARRKAPGLSGLGYLSGPAEDWTSVYNAANAQYEQLSKAVQDFPVDLRSGYQSVLFVGAGSILGQLQLSHKYGSAGNYEPAAIWAQAAQKNLGRIAPLISADKADPSGISSSAMIKKRQEDIARAQAANEAERQLAEQGAIAYIATKTGQAAGSAVSAASKGALTGVTSFLKMIPWWVYPVAIGGAVLYFAGPALIARKAMSAGRGILAAKKVPSLAGEPENAYAFSRNPRRRKRR